VAFVAKHPRNLPAAYYKPIGQVIVRWGYTELYLQSVVWHIWRIKDPKAARLLTWDLGAASKVELFKYLAPKWITDTHDRKGLIEIAKEAERLRQLRNKLAHGLWGYRRGERKKHYLLQIRRQTRILPKAEVVAPTNIAKWAADLDALNVRLQSFHRHLGAPTP
jgi:hypothetical protein